MSLRKENEFKPCLLTNEILDIPFSDHEGYQFDGLRGSVGGAFFVQR